MRHEGNKQGLYREKKILQLEQERYDALQKRAYSIVKRSDAIQAFMEELRLPTSDKGPHRFGKITDFGHWGEVATADFVHDKAHSITHV